MTSRPDGVTYARFAARENRFVVRAETEDGSSVRAYLPNTARLTDLLAPGVLLVLEPTAAPHRRTRWTVTRVWDGTWVALAAGVAADLVAAHLSAGEGLAGWPQPVAVRREVAHAGRRFDLEVELGDGRSGIVEVKSLSRVRAGTAPLSDTPSTRGVAHLRALAELAATGRRTAVVFVVQRGDAEVLSLTAPAAPSWVDAVRRARRHGVDVLAYACEVTEHELRLGRPLAVRDAVG